MSKLAIDREPLRHEATKLDSYLDESVKLRAMDKDQLNDLITQICKLDQGEGSPRQGYRSGQA